LVNPYVYQLLLILLEKNKSMKKIIFLIIKIIALISSINIVNAALIDNGNGTITQIRNDGSKLMWLKDANYAMTSGYDLDGWMTWTESNLWIDHLNKSNLFGYNDWRLPEANPIKSTGYDWSFSYDGSTDYGYNITNINAEMSYMFYEDLGNTGFYDINGHSPLSGWGLNNNGPFDNILITGSADYWTGTNYTPNPEIASSFNFNLGFQNQEHKSLLSNPAWAVRVISVPEPKISILFAIGIIMLTNKIICYKKGRDIK